MQFKKAYLLLVLLLLSVSLAGCVDQSQDEQLALLQQQVAGWEQLAESHGLLLRSLQAIELIKDQNWEGLSGMVHPEQGLRFTPYPYVDVQKDQAFTAEQVAGLDSDTTVYQWGSYDGSGDPIELSFHDYYERFVYDHDFASSQVIGNNHAVSHGNTLDNVSQAYSNGKFIEFYFEGFDPQYQGMDWSSLKLVFEQVAGEWYLVGIVHGEWTI
jgi:hypothetical protein